MEQIDAKSFILKSRIKAASHIANIKEASPLTYELLDQEITAYILAKFHLEPQDCCSEIFSDLAELSLSKSMKLSPELVKEFDIARSCDGVSSKSAKMFLLYMALQKDLSIKLPPKETAYVESVHDISKLVWKVLPFK